MLFNSLEFIFIFLPALALLFRLLQNKITIALTLLLIASFAFYAYHSMFDLSLMILSIIFNFFIGHHVFKNKQVLVLGIFLNICLIAYFKYSFFIFVNIINFVPVAFSFEKIALPLGISFFTFQQVAYLVDTYYGAPAEKSVLKYALLVSFFPHSISGPLVQYKEIAPQFKTVKLNIANLSIGGQVLPL